MNNRIICTLLFFFTIAFSYSQQDRKLDSLKQLLKTGKEDTLQLNHINKIGYYYLSVGVYDSCFPYIKPALDLGEKIANATKNKNNSVYKAAKRGIGAAYYNLGIYHYYKSKYNEAIEALNIGLSNLEEGGYKLGVAKSLLQIGGMYYFLGNYSKALEYYIKSSNTLEKLGEKRTYADACGNIGAIFQMQKNYPKALEYFQNALKKYSEVDFKIGIGISYMNIGNIYKETGDYTLGQQNILKAINVQKETGYSKGLAECYIGLGDINRILKKFDFATENYSSALHLYDSLMDKEGRTFCYTYLGRVYFDKKNYSKTIELSNKGLDLSKEIGLREMEKESYDLLSKSFAATNNYKLAYHFYQKFTEIKDTLFNKENSKKIAEMDAIYETDKKEQQLSLIKIEQEKEREVALADSKKQKIFLLLIAAIAIGIGIITIIVFRSLRITKKQKKIIEIQKNEVLQQKDLVEVQQKEIIDSINYAKRLQEAILPPLHLIKKNFPNSFVLYKPKAIVAGDFYWMEKIENFTFIAAADCTGHGVPGAMVSVVCSNALNRAVKEFNLKETGLILDKTRELVLETFEKSNSDVKDGMDISLLCFDDINKNIFWSGANNPLWYIQNNALIEVKCDKQPIGKTDNIKSFTTHKIDYKKDTTFYLFTDGLSDQFGGPKGKKFKYKQFSDLLLQNTNLSQQEQAEIIESTFSEWKGNLEQVDDVCVIGIKL